MITFTDPHYCIFLHQGTEYKLPMTLQEIRQELASSYVEVPVHPYYSNMREKEIEDVEESEIEEYVLENKDKWELVVE